MSPRPPQLGVGSRVGAWVLLSTTDAAVYSDGKLRSRWWAKCSCGRREAVFDRDLKPRRRRGEELPPRRQSCGGAACKVVGVVTQRQIDRTQGDVVELLTRHGIDPRTADELAAALAFEQRARLESELRGDEK